MVAVGASASGRTTLGPIRWGRSGANTHFLKHPDDICDAFWPALETILHSVISLLATGILAAVAYGDLRTRRIPNKLVAAIGILGLARIFVVGDPNAALYTLAAAAAVFAAALLLFWRNFVGGGDVKLLAASVLLVGHYDLFRFLFVMSLCGMLLALAVVAADRLGPWLRPVPRSATAIPAEEQTATPARLSVPYGVAIAAAGVVTLVLQSFVQV
jgi:prepilin peptidase CpaA